MNFGSRLKEIRKYKSFVQKEFANILGVSQGTLSDLEKNKTAPSFQTLQKLKNRFADISSDWLLTGVGEMFITDSEIISSESNQILHVVSDIAAGEPVESTGERLDSFTIGRSFIQNVNDFFCFRVNGRSMEPDIQHQDLVLVKKDSNWDGKEDEVCAVRIDGEITLKRITHDRKHNMLVLISDNKDYMPIIVDTKHSDVLLIGCLHMVVRRLKS
jgi:SOS-response transcriptional repressor LexA